MSVGHLLGVDIGTSSSKAVLVSASGEIVARANRPHRTCTPRPGWYEHDADAVWDADFVALTRQVLAAAPAATIAGVAVSGIGPCLLPADAAGRPLRPAILYGIDTRAGAQIAQLTAELGADEIVRRAGSALTSQSVGPKLLWLRQLERATYERTAHLFMASSYLVHRLTGEYVLDHHSASQCAPMYDLAGQHWDAQWCEHVAPGLPLPQLRWPSEVAGLVTAAAASRTGIPAGTPVTTGTIDAWAEATSVGIDAPGDVMVMYGTTMFLIEVVARLTRHRAVWAVAGTTPGRYDIAATLPTSGALTAWLSKLTATDFPELLAAARRSGPGARGLLMLPHLAGERTPRFDPDQRGAVLGLSLDHERGDLYRAALEGVAFGVRENLAAMAEAAGRTAPPRLVAVGGGTQGGLWAQIVADVVGQAQQLPTETVGACLGDAMLAALAVGAAADVSGWNPPLRAIEPDPSAAARYASLYPLYLEFADRTRSIAHELAHRDQGPEPE